MPVQGAKSAIHPVAIFNQAWSACWKNLSKLSVIYLIFNLPGIITSLYPMLKPPPNQKPGLVTVLWFLFLIIINSWGYIALLLAAKQAVNAQDYTISQSINRAKAFLVKYLALILSLGLFFMGIIVVAGVSAVVVWALFSKANIMLATLICFVLIVATIVSVVFFSLRWALATLVCVFEKTGPISALKGSFALVKEHINPLVGTYGLITSAYIICVVPVFIAVALVVRGSNLERPAQIGTAISTILINIVLVPFFTTLTVVLYKKLKEVSEAHVHA